MVKPFIRFDFQNKVVTYLHFMCFIFLNSVVFIFLIRCHKNCYRLFNFMLKRQKSMAVLFF